jgi:protein O-mannosyl-transferase
MGILSITLCLTIALFNSNQTWVSAAQIAENTIASLKSLDSANKLYVLNLPDRYRGAYIFRNSFPRAVQLFVPGKFAEVQTISFHNLESVNHRFLATDSKLNSLDAPVQFYFKSKGEIFKPQLANLETKNFGISDLSDRGFSFSLPNFKAGDKLVYYSDRKLTEIP